MIEYRKIKPEDFEQVLVLQQQNLLLNISPKIPPNPPFVKGGTRSPFPLMMGGISEGFLSTAYTLEQFQGMNDSMAVVVCVENGQVLGYFCLSQVGFFQSLPHPFPKKMIEHCAEVIYQDRPLSQYSYFIANPICIEKEYRGQDLYFNLCKKSCEYIPKTYDFGIAFISKKNHRSLGAGKKISLETIGEFTVQEEDFWLLKCPTAL